MDILNYKHIIWDWNGTLLDDVWLCVEIINAMLAKRNLAPVSRDGYREAFTFPVQDYYQKLGFDFEREPFETISTEFISQYEDRRSECSLMHAAPETLATVSQLGLTQSVLSASKKSYLKQALEEYGLSRTFMTVDGLDNHHATSKVEQGKNFIAYSNLLQSQILLVGDTIHDAEVASAIGTDCCLIPNGHQSRKRLATCGVPLIGSLSVLGK